MKKYVKIHERPRDQAMVLISNSIKRRCKTVKIYRGSEDGFSTESFHRLCDGISPTLTIIKSEHNKVFGGFTSVSWGPLQQGKTGHVSPSLYKADP